jgi:hypothetical protein
MKEQQMPAKPGISKNSKQNMVKKLAETDGAVTVL